MTEDLLDTIPERPVYTIRTIVISSLFGGILSATYMIHQNYKALGENKKAGITILLGIVFMALTIATAFIPVLENMPGILFTLITTIIISFLAEKYQGKLISKHIEAEGRIHTTGRAVLVCVIAILIIAALIVGAYFLGDADVSV